MNTTTFGAAVEAAKEGHQIARAGWNGKGMWLILFSQSMFITVDMEEGEPSPLGLNGFGYSQHIGDTGTGIEHIGITSDGNDFYPLSDFFLLKTADNKCVPWNASQPDTLAEDWLILPRYAHPHLPESAAPATAVNSSDEALVAVIVRRYGQPTQGTIEIVDRLPLGSGVLQFQATVSGYTDWFAVKFDEAGQPDPVSLQQLPF